jgi:hypothetical protein
VQKCKIKLFLLIKLLFQLDFLKLLRFYFQLYEY